MTLDEERAARVQALNKAMDAAGIPRAAYHIPDLTGHTVNIPAAVLFGLAGVVQAARAGEDQANSLETLAVALSIYRPDDLVCGQVGQDARPVPPKPKRVLSEAQKAALAAGREKARAKAA